LELVRGAVKGNAAKRCLPVIFGIFGMTTQKRRF
jgi:hypothetical protein